MPRIQMTRTVKFALYFLRVYLIVLLTLIAVRFVKVFAGSGKEPPHAAPATAPVTLKATTATVPTTSPYQDR
jgi:hypothetical protein